MTVMGIGTTYEQKGKDGQPTSQRFYECRKCHERVYKKKIDLFNFQEYLDKLLKN